MFVRQIVHLLFCLVILSLFLVQPWVNERYAVFGYFLFLAGYYNGRWIAGQSYKANRLDMFRMFFLSFFFLSVSGLVVFARYIESKLPWMHYLESWINISAYASLALLAGFFVYRIRKKALTAALKKQPVNPAGT